MDGDFLYAVIFLFLALLVVIPSFVAIQPKILERLTNHPGSRTSLSRAKSPAAYRTISR